MKSFVIILTLLLFSGYALCHEDDVNAFSEATSAPLLLSSGALRYGDSPRIFNTKGYDHIWAGISHGRITCYFSQQSPPNKIAYLKFQFKVGSKWFDQKGGLMNCDFGNNFSLVPDGNLMKISVIPNSTFGSLPIRCDGSIEYEIWGRNSN